MSYYTYILYAEPIDQFYIGITANLQERILRHNQGRSKATKKGAPHWKILHFEIFPSRAQAYQREQFLKKMKSSVLHANGNYFYFSEWSFDHPIRPKNSKYKPSKSRKLMDKSTFKTKVRDQAKEILQIKAKELEKEIRRYQDSEMQADEDQFDMTQQSMDDANREIIDQLLEQLNYVTQDLVRLDMLSVDEKLSDTVAPGAVVFTNKRNFYISVGTEEFEIDNKKIVGLSPQAPLYEEMKNHKAGDQFNFRGTTYKIKEIF